MKQFVPKVRMQVASLALVLLWMSIFVGMIFLFVKLGVLLVQLGILPRRGARYVIVVSAVVLAMVNMIVLLSWKWSPVAWLEKLLRRWAT